MNSENPSVLLGQFHDSAARLRAVIEVREVRQVPNDYFRRWFADDSFDLMVWYEPDETIHGFQLSYDTSDHEKVLKWLRDRGVSHYSVDAGEESPSDNRSPLLVETSGRSEMARLLSCFQDLDPAMPAELSALVRGKIQEYGGLDSGCG